MLIGNTPVSPTDLVRQLVNASVCAGRILQSSQTGLVHYNHRQLDYPTYDTIPLNLNFYFALALTRERTAESFAEAKALLDRLLYFQAPADHPIAGNFPVYLHEYPECKDRWLVVSLLPVFAWISIHFPMLLTGSLKERYEKALSKALDYVWSLRHDNLPFTVALKIACYGHALAKLRNAHDQVQQADRWLQELLVRAQEPQFTVLDVPHTFAETLAALEWVYPDISQSPWAFVWERLQHLWHPKLHSYIGPGYHDTQFKEQPEVTILDLIAGFYAGQYSYRALVTGPHLIEAAIFNPGPIRLEYRPLSSGHQHKLAGRRWDSASTQDYALSLLEKNEPDPSRDSFYSPLKLMWGDINCLHSFVCQGGNASSVSYELHPDGADLLLTLSTEVPSEVRQRNREVSFYLDALEGQTITVADRAMATTFQLGEIVTLQSGPMTLHLTLKLEEGQGQFFGHIAKGNRPSQRNVAGDGRFATYDWHLFLRTVQRSQNCVVRASLRYSFAR